AAGHPPLRFEQASYEALIGSKHWDDRPQRKTEPGYEVQLWAAGRIAAAEAALAVLEGRARRAEAQGSDVEGQRLEYAPWPEFAEGNCFACHQPMRSVAGARSRSDGTLAWQSWNLAMLNSVVASGTAATTELPPAALAPSLNRLRMAMEGSFMPRPNQIAELAAAARTALRAAAKVDSHGRILDREGQPLQIRAAVERAPSVTSMQNWDELCQQTAALAAARRAIEDANNERQVEAEQRLLAVARLLRFQTADREWPAVFANITNESSQRRPVTLNEVIGALDQTRADLLRAAI